MDRFKDLFKYEGEHYKLGRKLTCNDYIISTDIGVLMKVDYILPDNTGGEGYIVDLDSSTKDRIIIKEDKGKIAFSDKAPIFVFSIRREKEDNEDSFNIIEEGKEDPSLVNVLKELFLA